MSTLEARVADLIKPGRHRCEINITGSALNFGDPTKTTDEMSEMYRAGLRRNLVKWFLETAEELGYTPPPVLLEEQLADGVQEAATPKSFDEMPDAASEGQEDDSQDGVEANFVEVSVAEIASAFQSGGEHAPVLLKKRLTQAHQAGMKQSLDLVETVLAGLYRGAEDKSVPIAEFKKRFGERLNSLKQTVASGDL